MWVFHKILIRTHVKLRFKVSTEKLSPFSRWIWKCLLSNSAHPSFCTVKVKHPSEATIGFFRKTLSWVQPSWPSAGSSVKIHFQLMGAVGCSPVCIPVQVTEGNWVNEEHPGQSSPQMISGWTLGSILDPCRGGKETLILHRVGHWNVFHYCPSLEWHGLRKSFVVWLKLHTHSWHSWKKAPVC